MSETAPAIANEVPQVSIIVPTYCEAKNLPVLIPRIMHVLQEANIRGEIIVVDDNSPDDTPQICRELSLKYPVRALIRKSDRGLASAVIHGMQQAQGQYLVVMDADLSHPPETIPELVNQIKLTAVDFVIGSRYVAGGSTHEDWGVFRWLNSQLATILARPFTSAKDPMAGFFALRRSTFETASRLDPVGYKIALELIVKCHCQNVIEIPISFGDRLHGESKLSIKEQLNYLRHIVRLFKYKLGAFAQPLKSALVGVTGAIVDLTSFYLLLMVMPANIGRALAIWIAMTWNFFINRRFTFSNSRSRPILHQYILFCVACLLGAVLNWSVFIGLYSNFTFCQSWPLLTAFVGIVVGFVANFLLTKHIAFKS